MKETKLSTVIDVISMGPFGSDIKVDNFISQGIPVLNGSNLTSHKLVENSFKYVSLEKANKLGKANAFRGDIIITHRGTLGQVAYIPQNSKYERYVISQSQFRVRFNDDLDPVYFSYLMKSEYGQKKLLSFKSHVGVPALAQATSNFKRLELKLHNNIDQKKIAAVLSALDDKIELNNQINTELEAMAKTLYDYWFVQFDFPDENGKPYQSSGGKMVFNGTLKREIPVGWEVKKLSAFAKTGSGGTPKSTVKEYYENGQIPWINSGELNQPFIVKTENFISEIGLKNSSAKLFPKQTILMAMYGATAGKTSIISFEATTNQAICAVMPLDKIMFYYTKHVLDDMYKYLINLSTGSARDNLSQDKIRNLDIVIPSEELSRKFCKIVTPFFRKIEINLQENQELAQLRDWLLPILMNGQVSVK